MQTVNVPESVLSKIGKNLHNKTRHPIEIIKHRIQNYFGDSYVKLDDLSPIVSTQANFDDLLIPSTHPARSLSDTFYIDEQRVLRTHTSAHQTELLRKGYTRFLVTGDVYRKDEIDRTHYPVFHQMEGLCVVPEDRDPREDLLKTLSGLVQHLFPGSEYRVNDDYFPFTHPSYEIEVKTDSGWMEILGCGVVQPKILENAGLYGKKAWAFGLGLERLAMKLYQIPDIRLFWSDSAKFLDQFKVDNHIFKMYSVLDSTSRDISFWIPKEQLNESNEWILVNDFYEIIRELGGDLIESVKLLDKYYHQKHNKLSNTYRIIYNPVDPSLTDPAKFAGLVNNIHATIGKQVSQKMSVMLR